MAIAGHLSSTPFVLPNTNPSFVIYAPPSLQGMQTPTLSAAGRREDKFKLNIRGNKLDVILGSFVDNGHGKNGTSQQWYEVDMEKGGET